MMKKQIVVISVLAAVIVGLLCTYFIVVKPIVEKEEPEETKAPIETAPGEDVGMANKILAYSYVPTSDMQSITVYNDYGKYRIYKDSKTDVFQIEGYEGIAFHEENMSSLQTSVGYPLAVTKISNPNPLEEYGLTDVTLEDGTVKSPVKFVLVTKNGQKYTGYLGNETVTGAGYYFLYAERPDVVYVVEKSVAEVLCAPVERLVSPMIVTPMTANDYFLVHDFTLMKGDELFVHIDYINEEDRANTELVTKTYNMIYPENLTPSAEAFSAAMLGFYTANSEGKTNMEVVHLGINDDILAKYNLVDNCYSLYYTYMGTENFLLISPQNTDGSYYVASPLFQQIVKADAEMFDFVKWSLFDWVEAPFFQMKIDFLSDITVESGDYKVTFDLRGDGQDLVVTERGTNNKPDVKNFRQFYKTILYASYEGECGLTADEMAMYRARGDKEAQLILTINTEEGRQYRYRFFRYSERRSYIELNGSGEFYVLRTVADKILSDAKRVQSGEAITSTDKY